MKSLIAKASTCIILASFIISSLCIPSGAYEPPKRGPGSGSPDTTEGSGTRERLKFWEFVLKTVDDRGSGR